MKNNVRIYWQYMKKHVMYRYQKKGDTKDADRVQKESSKIYKFLR